MTDNLKADIDAAKHDTGDRGKFMQDLSRVLFDEIKDHQVLSFNADLKKAGIDLDKLGFGTPTIFGDAESGNSIGSETMKFNDGASVSLNYDFKDVSTSLDYVKKNWASVYLGKAAGEDLWVNMNSADLSTPGTYEWEVTPGAATVVVPYDGNVVEDDGGTIVVKKDGTINGWSASKGSGGLPYSAPDGTF